MPRSSRNCAKRSSRALSGSSITWSTSKPRLCRRPNGSATWTGSATPPDPFCDRWAMATGPSCRLCRPLYPVLLRTRIEAVLERKRLGEQSKIASLGVLTADIVHEVRNPLNFVLNFAELAEDLIREQEALLEKGTPERLADLRRMA